MRRVPVPPAPVVVRVDDGHRAACSLELGHQRAVPDAEGREQHAAVFVAKVVDDVDEQQGIVHGAGDVPGARPSGNGAGARPGFGARSTG